MKATNSPISLEDLVFSTRPEPPKGAFTQKDVLAELVKRNSDIAESAGRHWIANELAHNRIKFVGKFRYNGDVRTTNYYVAVKSGQALQAAQTKLARERKARPRVRI